MWTPTGRPRGQEVYGGSDQRAGFGALKEMFIDGDPARPNEQYFKFLDYVVQKAESLGLYVALVPCGPTDT